MCVSDRCRIFKEGKKGKWHSEGLTVLSKELTKMYLSVIKNVLIKSSLHNNIITVADYCYEYLAKLS